MNGAYVIRWVNFCLQAALALRIVGGKRREVVCAYKRLRRLHHRGDIERGGILPYPARSLRGADDLFHALTWSAEKESVAVGLAQDASSRMELRCDNSSFDYPDTGGQNPIKGAFEIVRRNRYGQLEGTDLALGMHSCIGPPRPLRQHLFRSNGAKGAGQCALNCR